jgi:hypothetical protein
VYAPIQLVGGAGMMVEALDHGARSAAHADPIDTEPLDTEPLDTRPDPRLSAPLAAAARLPRYSGSLGRSGHEPGSDGSRTSSRWQARCGGLSSMIEPTGSDQSGIRRLAEAGRRVRVGSGK